ncbi:MAG TPA: type Z 30S ribosomal protein S14 [Gemmataceae bacterium]|jgi:ribosomal protein S14|nr:type Z 30S ribosomal protein S14 [Gemmataceae bacterium]
MSTEAKLVKYRRQLATLDANKKDPTKTTLRPRDKIRIRFRCRLCGRPRAIYRKFGVCRICFRKMASDGLIPGVTKASW